MNARLTRLTGLILVPVLLLAVIAGIGLVEYRHAVTAEARETAEQWTRKVDEMVDALVAEAQASRTVVPYRVVPIEGAGGDRAEAEALARATAGKDMQALRTLLNSRGTTASGLPVRVLAAWRLLELSGTQADADRLAELAIHEQPSAISAPIVEALAEEFATASDWQRQWQLSEQKRAVLARHPNASGFVKEREGPAFITSGKVLTPQEVRAYVKVHGATLARPLPWMAIDYEALGSSLVAPIERPLVAAGAPLRMVVGIGDANILYARYWRVLWWVAAVIAAALITTSTGIWLIHQVVKRERKLSDLKNQFVASVSHELRAPVASMRLMADALDAGKVNDETVKDFHRLMSQEGARLSSLIENVLDFARIEEGRKQYQLAEADLEGLVADTIHLMGPVAKERKVTLVSEIDSLPTTPLIDSSAMQQALVNLLDNAIKFSPENGTVQVALSPENEGWRLSVSDRGPGIPLADRHLVFQRFSRLGNELRRETKGAGIGLSIVKHVVDAHGARISVEDCPGGGTRVVVSSARGRPEGKRDSRRVAGRAESAPTLRPCDS